MSDDAAKQRRARQTLVNLLLALAACLGMVLVIVLITPRSDSNLIPHVDYKQVAKTTKKATNLPILDPKIEAGWWSNAARFDAGTADGVKTWYVGFVGPKGEYVGVTQAFNSNPTWLAIKVQGDIPVSKATIGGREWTVYQNPQPNDPPKTMDYVLATQVATAGGQHDDVLVYGTAGSSINKNFANVISNQIQRDYK